MRVNTRYINSTRGTFSSFRFLIVHRSQLRLIRDGPWPSAWRRSGEWMSFLSVRCTAEVGCSNKELPLTLRRWHRRLVIFLSGELIRCLISRKTTVGCWPTWLSVRRGSLSPAVTFRVGQEDNVLAFVLGIFFSGAMSSLKTLTLLVHPGLSSLAFP